jgi:hypothetical protein
MENVAKTKLLRLISTVMLTLVSFAFSYFVFSNQANQTPVGSYGDDLSGEEYSTEGAYNYREGNPYGSYLVGFDAVSERGVSGDDMNYIYDVLINFLMYDKKVYNGKISYVKDSFERQTTSGITPKYSFLFGINDKDIHTMNVSSNILTEKITISITNNKGAQEFNRTFHIYSD